MGALILRHNRTRQPQVPVLIDWSNPLTKGLSAACIPFGNTFIELISGRLFDRLAPAAEGCTAQGRWLGSLNTGAGFFIDDLPLHISGVNEFSVVSTVVNFVENNTRKRVVRFSDPIDGTIHTIDYAAGSGGVLENKIAVGSRASVSSYVSFAADSGHAPKVRIIGASNRCGAPGEWNFCIDGQQRGAVGSPTYAQTYYKLPTQIFISGNTATSIPLNGGVFNLLFFSIMKTAEELSVLTKNPYQIFRPMQRRLWVVPAAAEGVDALSASNLTISAPVLGTPALGQLHALTASGLTVEGPVLGAPTLAQIHTLVASGLTVSAPVLGTPAVWQAHSLVASALVVGSPVLDMPALTENAADVDALAADGLVVGSPVLGAPSLGQIHVLGTDGLIAGSPVLGSPSIAQIHALTALGLTVGAPVLGTPGLTSGAVAPITAAEVARTVRAAHRMKTVTASPRVKQVRYEVTRA